MTSSQIQETRSKKKSLRVFRQNKREMTKTPSKVTASKLSQTLLSHNNHVLQVLTFSPGLILIHISHTRMRDSSQLSYGRSSTFASGLGFGHVAFVTNPARWDSWGLVTTAKMQKFPKRRGVRAAKQGTGSRQVGQSRQGCAFWFPNTKSDYVQQQSRERAMISMCDRNDKDREPDAGAEGDPKERFHNQRETEAHTEAEIEAEADAGRPLDISWNESDLRWLTSLPVWQAVQHWENKGPTHSPTTSNVSRPKQVLSLPPARSSVEKEFAIHAEEQRFREQVTSKEFVETQQASRFVQIKHGHSVLFCHVVPQAQEFEDVNSNKVWLKTVALLISSALATGVERDDQAASILTNLSEPATSQMHTGFEFELQSETTLTDMRGANALDLFLPHHFISDVSVEHHNILQMHIHAHKPGLTKNPASSKEVFRILKEINDFRNSGNASDKNRS